MITRAQEKAQKLNSGTRCRFHIMDAANLEFPDDHFDAVMSAYVITTVSDPRRVCREVLRVVKPGGQIIVINHSRCQNGNHLGRIEDLMAPLFVRIGFTTDLDVIGVMKEAGIAIDRTIPCNLLKTGRIIVGTKK